MQTSHTIIVADDHPLFRAALMQSLGSQVSAAKVLEAETLQQLEDQIQTDIDLVLLDLHMPGASGFSGLIYLRTHFPSVPVVVVSGNEQASVIHRAMHFGASGFIPKSSSMSTIAQAIQLVLDGGQWVPDDVPEADQQVDAQDSQFADQLASLTPQQFKVMVMLTEGLLNKQIAYELNVSEATIKAHVTAILRKLGVYSRTQAVIAAGRLRIEHPQDESIN
ncbi:MAG: response regulator transcription factor [Oceanospirillaceae bacterium]|jgi:DNA-binding NarL/FixJ family response regulator|nr:response regulator transcription factor [Oceanospirillaceae bacterium]MBT4442909.1 response regulator transcription factor [Oceanospirillaceae bacterium]MBT6076887.1 response regulator transcription factor [Oceanospirillaceae bacterium]MBT7329618.1 response regulator transcription factor [Oceanospirillaceae bacterium]